MSMPMSPPQPIVSSAESWHLARAQTLGWVRRLIEGNPGPLTRSVQTALREVREEEQRAWQEYFEHVGAPFAVQESVDAIEASFDPEMNMPIVRWPDADRVMSDSWGFVDLPAEGGPFTLTTPFRSVFLSKLPPGSVPIPISDARHSATAAFVEALQCAQRDVEAAFLATNEAVALRRLGQVIGIYRQAAKLVYRRVLRGDDFNDWTPTLPRKITLARAGSLISQVGATARAHEMLAFHVLAQWMQGHADRVERELPEGQRLEAFRTELRNALELHERSVAPMHEQAMAESGLDAGSYRCQVIFRPIPNMGPTLVAIPMSAGTVVPLHAASQPGAQDRV